MRAWTRIGIGLAATWLAGWAYHAPLGAGERLIDGLERQVRAVVEASEIETVTARLPRKPLARTVIFDGEANEFQREGQGSLPGLDERAEAVPGVAGVRWGDLPGGDRVVPLLAETFFLITFAYAAGLGFAWLLWGRNRDDAF